jgi:acetolactate synthase-1/2/3 large subunit
MLWGAKMDFFDGWGQRWKIARTMQVTDDQNCLATWLPTELAVVADPGVVLRQVIAYIKENGLKVPASRAAWVQQVQAGEVKRVENLMANAERFKDRAPIHGLYLSKVIRQTLEDLYQNNYYACFDAFTGSNLLSPYLCAKLPSTVLDAGGFGSVGHSVGHTVGIAMATDRKVPILSMIGDGGIGLGGFDIETAVRYKVPAVYVVYNNDMWLGDNAKAYGPNLEYLQIPEGQTRPNFLQENLRYDKMFEFMGAYGEWVTQPNAIRPALERAFKSAEAGVPAVVNVDVSNEPIQAIIDGPIVGLMWAHIPWNDCTNIMKKMRRKWMGHMFGAAFEANNIELEDYDRYERIPGDFDIKGR